MADSRLRSWLSRYHGQVKYLIVGGSAFACEYGSFLLLYEVSKLPLYWANSLSFLAGLIVSFFFNRMWTFNGQVYSRKAHHQLMMYATLALINIATTSLLISALHHAGIAPVIGKIFAMAAVVTWNFFIFKKLIFV